jgi:hypothetical protein
VYDGTSAVGKSRHRIPGSSVGQPTEPCLAAVLAGRALAAKVTLLENPPSPIGLGCADIANAITRPYAVASCPPFCDPSETEAEEGMGPVKLFRTHSTLTPRTRVSLCGKLTRTLGPEGCP